jgi:hypothetical protein
VKSARTAIPAMAFSNGQPSWLMMRTSTSPSQSCKSSSSSSRSWSSPSFGGVCPAPVDITHCARRRSQRLLGHGAGTLGWEGPHNVLLAPARTWLPPAGAFSFRRRLATAQLFRDASRAPRSARASAASSSPGSRKNGRLIGAPAGSPIAPNPGTRRCALRPDRQRQAFSPAALPFVQFQHLRLDQVEGVHLPMALGDAKVE